ncbi:uncharacterized protein K02A2.6-like [Cydia fagiglandana]|uniref:uncharacterized protein K02A2.6-like n=1 Tax=Cydia fagiglandana TaxID=1458189 RepID=UPI002FEE0002
MLRDRLVCGMNDHKLQYELLKKNKLSYKDVVDAILSSESAEKDVRMIVAGGVSDGSTSSATAGGTEPAAASTAPEPMDVNAVHSKRTSGGTSTRLCYRCGDHHGGECRFANAICRYCKKKGHLEKICLAKKKGGNRTVNYTHTQEEQDEYIGGIYNVGADSRVPPFDVQVALNGVQQRMQVDTGAAYSLVNERTWRALARPPLTQPPIALRTWTSAPLELIGQTTLHVQYKDITCDLSIYVAKGKGPNLIGRDWFAPLKFSLNVDSNDSVLNLDIDHNTDTIMARHSEVFKDGLGTYRGQPVTIHVKPGAAPKYIKARPVPYAIKDRVEKEIDRLVHEKVLRPVSFSEWATPVVPIIKKSGDIRLCGDYRSTVNQATESDTYPMPTANEVFATIAGGKYFSTLDLNRAYTQVTVDDATAKLLTLNTCKGLYSVHRLAFGVKASPGIFQRLMTALLAGIQGVAVLIDDIIISGRTLSEMWQRLDEVLTRIGKAGLRLNSNKCKLARQKVEFLGYVIDAVGIHPAPSKVEAIINTPEPQNVHELQAFLGLYNFYERFIPHKATMLEPLHRLLDKTQAWKWTEIEQTAFEKAKHLLSFDMTLVHYDLNKRLLLTCDSSEYGVGAVLAHVMDDGQERPIAMSSRTLHIHERRYSQLDKEAASIMFGIQKFHNYLIGRSFTIVTDHKPLLGIFDPKKPMPGMISPRLTRIALALTAHSYEIIYKPGPQIGHADGLSRWPQPVPDQPEQDFSEILLIAETPQDFPFDADQIAKETKKDVTLAAVMNHIYRGWPAKITDNELRPYWLHRTELSLQEDCILLGCRVVIPPALRKATLHVLHSTHNGIVQTKALARSYVWWPQLNEEIEKLIGNCSICLEHRHMPPKTSHEWITPTRPWSRIHVDFAGPFQGKIFLIVVDSYSRWPEVFMVPNTSSATVIKNLRGLFATHGLCETIVSDNGTAFTSTEMEQFLQANKIKHAKTAPYHPATNGLAERMVQTVKNKLRKMNNMPWDVLITNMLLGLRSTPCSATNKSPAELLMNRKLRTLLDVIHPDNIAHKKVEQQIDRNAQVKRRESNIGQKVMYRNYGKGAKWLPGTVVSKGGPSSYQVEATDGSLVNRHIDQLIKTTAEDSTVTDRVLPEDEVIRGEGTPDEDNNDKCTDMESASDADYKDDTIIEIPSSNQWAAMLGIPPIETSQSVGKVSKKARQHSKAPYDRPGKSNN